MKKFCKKAFFSTESFAKPNITDLSYYSHLTQRGVISIEGKDSFRQEIFLTLIIKTL